MMIVVLDLWKMVLPSLGSLSQGVCPSRMRALRSGIARFSHLTVGWYTESMARFAVYLLKLDFGFLCHLPEFHVARG